MNSLLTFYAESKDTGGSFKFGEWLGKPGNEPPPYVHEREHEFYYLPEREIDADIGSDVFRVAQGEFLLIPQHKPHTFLIRSPRRLSVLDEAQSFDRLVGKGTVSCFRARRFRQECPALVVADRVDLDPGASGRGSDSHCSISSFHVASIHPGP